MKEPDLSFLKGFRKVFLFTYHALDLVHLVSYDLIRMMAQCAEKVVCTHIEPIGFQLNPNLGEITKKQKDLFHSRSWNINLWETLAKAQKEGLLQIKFTAQEIICDTDPWNPVSLVVWKAGQ